MSRAASPFIFVRHKVETAFPWRSFWFLLAAHMCPAHENQERAWLVRSSAQANLIGCGCAAQRGAR
jgi:hypothetical protein